MEITLEKIELVKDRTGVSYKEAKEALEASEGNVVDAIIAIEETINTRIGAKVSDQGEKVIQKIKEYVKKGNISRIIVKKEEEVVLNLPVTVGIVGTVLAPWVTAIGAIVALGTKCNIVLIKDDGEMINISDKANDVIDDVVDKGSDVIDSVKAKTFDTFDKAGDIKDKVADDFSDIKDIVKDAAQDLKEAVGKDVEDIQDVANEAAEEIKATVEEATTEEE